MDGEMVTTRSKKLGVSFTTGSRDFLSISLEKNEMRASRRITGKPWDDAIIIVKSFACPSVGHPHLLAELS